MPPPPASPFSARQTGIYAVPFTLLCGLVHLWYPVTHYYTDVAPTDFTAVPLFLYINFGIAVAGIALAGKGAKGKTARERA